MSGLKRKVKEYHTAQHVYVFRTGVSQQLVQGMLVTDWQLETLNAQLKRLELMSQTVQPQLSPVIAAQVGVQHGWRWEILALVALAQHSLDLLSHLCL
jgi:hypothetical protein